MQRRGLSFGAGCKEDHFVEVDSYAIAFSGLSVRTYRRGNSMGLIFDARNPNTFQIRWVSSFLGMPCLVEQAGFNFSSNDEKA